MSRPSHLKVVEFDDNGEVHEDDCPSCKRKNDEIAGLERDVRGWAVRYRELQRDKAVEAREHPLWPVGEALFRAWRKRCNHPRSPWTPDRFWAIEPFLTNGKYGPTLEARVMLCARAIAGAGFDPFKLKRKNGSVKVFNDWDLIHRSSDKWEEFCCKAPLKWTPVLSDGLLAAIGLAEARLASLREAAKA